MTAGTQFLRTIFEYGWHGSLPLLLACVVVLSLLLYRFSPESRQTLKHTLIVLMFGMLGLFVSGLFQALAYTTVASILHVVSVFAQGAALIRLAGLVFFRVFLNLLHARPPSILEEILLVFAYFGLVMVLLHRAGLNLPRRNRHHIGSGDRRTRIRHAGYTGQHPWRTCTPVGPFTQARRLDKDQ